MPYQDGIVQDRKLKVLAVGSGPFLLSLVEMLLESGWTHVQVLVTQEVQTDRSRMAELAVRARAERSELKVEETVLQGEGVNAWREALQPFHAVMYVSQQGNIEQLLLLDLLCRQQLKAFLPALCLGRKAMAGPLLPADAEHGWESVWRSVHYSELGETIEPSGFSPAAGAMLANAMVLEWCEWVSQNTKAGTRKRFFLLDMHTLEGSWHAFTPHPLADANSSACRIQDFVPLLEQQPGNAFDWLVSLKELTLGAAGIFHMWEEGDLLQLPLAQCRVQPVDPLSEGPAGLLQEMIRSGLTHEEAQRDAGLSGIEAYAEKMKERFAAKLPLLEHNLIENLERIGIGAGETFAEAACRGLEHMLQKELGKRLEKGIPTVKRLRLTAIEDERCRFYLQALTVMQGAPFIGSDEELHGFPVFWVRSNGYWYGGSGLNQTLALRRALQRALLTAQNNTAFDMPHDSAIPSVIVQENEDQLAVRSLPKEATEGHVIESAMKILEHDRKRLLVFKMVFQPFMNDQLVGVYGLMLREEESR